MDEARDELDRWRRAWSVVVRRDILRQQRAVVTSHKDMLVMLKRTAIATQKEVRKRALRAQRLSSNPVIQLRCKKLARDVTNLAAQLEAAQDDRLVAAEKAAFLRRRQLGISSAAGAADATSRRQLGLPSASGATYRSSAVSAVGAAGGSTSGSAPPRKRSRTADDAEGRAAADEAAVVRIRLKGLPIWPAKRESSRRGARS